MQRRATEWRAHGHRGNLAAALGLGGIGASFLLISTSTPFPGWWALLPTCGAALILFGGPRAWVNRTLLSGAMPVRIGKISFALYLWHWPLLSFAQMGAGGPLSAAARVGVLAMSVVLAWGTHVLIENPVRFGAHRAKIPLLIAAMLLMAGMAGLTVKGDGLSFRYGTVELRREPGRFECADQKKNSGCVFGNPHADKLVVVVGDSHAEHLTKALNEAFGRDYLFTMVTNGSCFMGTKIFHPETGNLKDCTAAIDRLASLRGRHVYAVIRSQRWHAYGADSPAGITALMRDAMLAGGLQPEKIIIVGSTANVPFDCEVANYYAMPLSAKRICTVKNDYKDLNRMFIATTRAMPVPANVHFVYPYLHLCPNDTCTVIRGNVANYSDTHHMTVDGARQIIPDIARALGAALPSPAPSPSPVPSAPPSPATVGRDVSNTDHNSL